MLQGDHSAKLSTFIKPPFVIKVFVLSNFEWPFYIGFTEFINCLVYPALCIYVALAQVPGECSDVHVYMHLRINSRLHTFGDGL